MKCSGFFIISDKNPTQILRICKPITADLLHHCVLQHFLDLQLVKKHQYSASLLHCHDTDTRATMNMAVGDGVIAAGQDGSCRLMKFKQCRQKGGGQPAAQEGEPYCTSLKYSPV